MSPVWIRFVVLLVLELSVTSAWPAQKFSPGIAISPTVNQNPGQVSGIIAESTSGTAKVTYQTYSPPVAPAPVIVQPQLAPAPVVVQAQPAPARVIVQAQPAPQRTVYLQGNRPMYSSPQYTGQAPTAYVYPDGTYAQPPPTQSATRFGNTYYSSPSNNYPSSPSNYYSSPDSPPSYYSNSPSNYYSSPNSPPSYYSSSPSNYFNRPNSLSSSLSDSLGWGSSRPSYTTGQALGALTSLGALGTLGAGALGAGALLFG